MGSPPQAVPLVVPGLEESLSICIHGEQDLHVVTFAAHAREIDAVDAGGTAAVLSVPSDDVRTTLVIRG